MKLKILFLLCLLPNLISLRAADQRRVQQTEVLSATNAMVRPVGAGTTARMNFLNDTSSTVSADNLLGRFDFIQSGIGPLTSTFIISGNSGDTISTFGTWGPDLLFLGGSLTVSGVIKDAGITSPANALLGVDATGNFSEYKTAGVGFVAPGGAGTVSGLTANKMPKASSATALADGPINVASVTNIQTDGSIFSYSLQATQQVSISGSVAGSLELRDDDGSHGIRLVPSGTTTANINLIFPAAAASGVLTSTLSAATNATLSIQTMTYFVQTSDVTVANTVTETTVLGTVTGSKTLPVNTLTAGKSLRGILRGRISGDTIATGTLRVRVKLGATTILDSAAQALPNNTSNELFDIDFDITCRTVGASGTIWAQGKAIVVDSTGLVPTVLQMVNTATSTIDTTATQAVDVTIQWGTADADNTATFSIANLATSL